MFKFDIKLIIRKLLELLPESWFYKILCFNYNVFWRKKIFNYIPKEFGFKIYYKNGLFIVKFKEFVLNFYEEPFSEILNTPIGGYLKYYKLKKGDYVVDGGAYVGVFTMIASKLVEETGLIISFEPDPENYQKLVDNIKLNSLDNVIPINKGLWNADDTLNFQNTNLKSSSLFFEDSNAISVDVVSLDNELNRLKINDINFIKLDIEGAEIEFIKGAENILNTNEIHLAIASYHVVNGSKTFKKLESDLRKYGFVSKTSYPKHLTTYACKY